MTDSAEHTSIPKRSTGIRGFDKISHGGLPRRGVTLMYGGAGTGKTVFALNLLVNAAREGNAGVFITFEEPIEEILCNADGFDWDLRAHAEDRITLIDGRPHADADVAGEFDIGGLLAVLDDIIQRTKPAWVVLDGIDQLLGLANNPIAAVREVSRLGSWLRECDLTTVITAKKSAHVSGHGSEYLDRLQFLFPAVVELTADLVARRLSRKLRMVKYRGSAHVADEVPIVMDSNGVNLPYYGDSLENWVVSNERVSTGVARLDELLNGGYFRGTGILISGEPGTAKTTLSTSFVNAAAARGERSLYFGFDESSPQIVRNVASVGIDLQPHVDAGLLSFRTLRAVDALVETHYMEILQQLDAIKPHCVVIDPVSALLKAGGESHAYLSIERLLDMIRSRGITCLMTSLIETSTREVGTHAEGVTSARVSTIADTWIRLTNHVIQGERNRALSIVKSRGTRHSNQLRELMLSDTGPDLAEVYTLGGEVLMGTARVARQQEEDLGRKRQDLEYERQRRSLESRLKQVQARLEESSSESETLQREMDLYRQLYEMEVAARQRSEGQILRSREEHLNRKNPTRRITGGADSDPGGVE